MHTALIPLGVVYHHEEQNGLLRPHRSPRILLPRPPIPLSAVTHLFLFPPCDSKCEELAGLLQYLTNKCMSVGKRWIEKER